MTANRNYVCSLVISTLTETMRLKQDKRKIEMVNGSSQYSKLLLNTKPEKFQLTIWLDSSNLSIKNEK